LDRQGRTDISQARIGCRIAVHSELADSRRGHAGGECAYRLDQWRPGGIEQFERQRFGFDREPEQCFRDRFLVSSPKLTSPAQLKGKTIGIDRFGGTGDSFYAAP
jgi:hypothetical protein